MTLQREQCEVHVCAVCSHTCGQGKTLELENTELKEIKPRTVTVL